MEVGGKEVNQMAVMVKDDKGDYVFANPVSTDYRLIKNHKARDIADDIMTRSDMDWNKHSVSWNGKRYATAFFSEQSLAKVGGQGLGRDLRMGLLTRNSYDGTSSFGIEFFICAYECKNQFIDRNRFGFFTMRHSNNSEMDMTVDDALEQMTRGADKLIKMAPLYEDMAKKPLELADIKQAAMAKLIPSGQWEKALAGLEQFTDWGLFNSLTNVSTHSLKGFSRLESGQKVGNYFGQKYGAELAVN